MRFRRYMAFAWIGCALSGSADTHPFAHAVATETNVFLGQVFTIDMIVRAPEPPTPPTLGTLPAFHVTPLDSGRTTGTTNTYLFRYAFRATQEGELTIPPFSFRAGQKVVPTPALHVRSRKPTASDRMALTVTPSARTAYQGEPIRLSVTWDSTFPLSALKAVDFHFPILNDPRFQVLDPYEPNREADNQDTGLPVHGTRVLAIRKSYESEGMSHQTLSFDKILIPKQAGHLRIPSSTLLCAAEADADARQRRRAAFQYPPYFDNTFFDQNLTGGEYTRIYVESDPIELEVKPLPVDGRPDLFNGMVGDFAITAAAEPTEVRVGEPITLTITVTATHTMENIFLEPLRYQPLLVNRFEIPSDRSLPKRQAASKIYTQTVRPLSTRITEIPPIQLAYFNPATHAYATTQSDPIPLRVSPGQTIPGLNANGTPYRQRLREGTVGIRHNYEAPDMLIRRRPPFLGWAHPAWVLSILLFPPLLAGGLSLLTTFSEKKHHIRRTAKAARAYSVYRRNATAIIRRHRTKRTVYSDLDRVVRAYLGDRLHLTPGALTFREVRAALEEAGADAEALDRLQDLFRRCEAYRFTEAYDESADAHAIVHQANRIIRTVDRSLK